MGESSASYIRMVHRLIEECLIFNMSKEECMEALFKHANVEPLITSTVWNELQKENKQFFEAYTSCRDQRATEIQQRKRIQTKCDASMEANDKN
ncbi:hypothetical protein GQ457_06G025330 [Hibiscus cannabinus]